MAVLQVDVEAIGRNTEVVAGMLARHGIDLVGVTKACLGDARVGAAMLAGGAVALADTRDQNLQRLRATLPGVELHRIYLPPLNGFFEPGNITYLSSLEGARAVAARSGTGRKRQRVMIHLETGDLRDGVPREDLVALVSAVVEDERLQLEGLSTNYACFEGTRDGVRESLRAIASAALELRAAGFPVERVSGGNSSILWLVQRGETLPQEITELRCGEALLFGHDALCYEELPGCRRDACLLRVEVLEMYTKPAVGGRRRRLVLGIGRQDLGSGAIRFVHEGLSEIGRSADYLVVEQAEVRSMPKVGDFVQMIPSYEALVAAWTSPYVERIVR
jgi:predicted amino acid racemase